MTAQPYISRVSPKMVRYLKLAASLGVKKDQMKRFLDAGYVSQPKQLEFHAAARAADDTENAREIGYGGARGGGKTHTTFAQVALDDCYRFPGLKVLFLRKVAKSANEAVEDLRQKVLFRTPHKFKENKNTIVFPNGSRIILGHFQYEKDIDNYLGLEYDIIVIEEATQLSQSKIDKIKTCNRSSKPGFRPRRYYTTNPGGIGHSWFKNKFVMPFRAKTEEANKTKFIPSTVYDNKKVNAEYKGELESLTGWLRKAWLDGDWDVFAGQFFDKFRYDLHTKDDSVFFTSDYISKNWENLQPWGAFDYGFVHWSVFYLGYKYDGKLYILDECAVRKSLVSQIGDAITETCGAWGLKPSQLRNIAAGTDCFATNSQTGDSIADALANKNIYINPAKTARMAGASKILTLIGDADLSIQPTAIINRRCRMLVEQLGTMIHNPTKAGDVLKVNADENGQGGDDGYDAFRYFCMEDTGSTGLF